MTRKTQRGKKLRVSRRKRKVSSFLKTWVIRVFLFIVVSVFGGGLYYVAFVTDTFHLVYFEVTGASEYVNENDLKNFLYSNYESKNLLLLDTTQLSSELKDVFLGAYNFEISKKWPDTLFIQVEERSPLAVLVSEKYNDKYMIDREGYVLGIVDSSRDDLPEIHYKGELKIGTFVDKNLVPVYSELLTATENSEVKVSSVSFYPKYISFFTEDGIQVLIDNEANKFESILVLSRLLHRLTLEGKDATSIDLRYDKVVVSY